MGDSEEEVDKRNVREKFKPERNDYDRHESRRNHNVSDGYVSSTEVSILYGLPKNRNPRNPQNLRNPLFLLLTSQNGLNAPDSTLG